MGIGSVLKGAAMGALGGLGGGKTGLIGGAIQGALGSGNDDSPGSLSNSKGTPAGAMNLSGGGSPSGGPIDTKVIKSKRKLSGGRSFSSK